MRRAAWFAFVLAVVACDRGHPREAPTATSPPMVAPATGTTGTSPTLPDSAGSATPGCSLAPIPLRRPAAPHRLVAVGDLHGDLAAMRAVLRAAGAIDDHDHWAGGDLVVVQTGDVLDRGDGERQILDLSARLETEAQAAGGAWIPLIGNHELMNSVGDFRYVTAAGMRAFDGAPPPAAPAPPGLPEAMRSRFAALGPGGSYAKHFAAHAAVTIVGDTVLSHAGVLPAWAARLDDVNATARCWLDGQRSEPPTSLAAQDSPVWTRAYGGDAVDCAQLHAALAALNAKRMVVAHTVQHDGIT